MCAAKADEVHAWTADFLEIPLSALTGGADATGTAAPGNAGAGAPGGPGAGGQPHHKVDAVKPHPGHGANAPAAPPVAAGPAPPDERQIAFDKAMIKNQLIQTITSEVDNRYAHLKTGLQDTINRQTQVITKLKEAAPKEPGSLLAVLGEVFIGVAMIAFPELIVIKVAAKGVSTATKVVEEGIKVKEVIEKVEDIKKLGAIAEHQEQVAEAAAAKSEFASKMAAVDALLNFADKSAKMIDDGGERFKAKAKAAVMAWDPPPDFHEKYIQRTAIDMDMVTEFLGSQMHITKPGGTAEDVKKVQLEVTVAVSKYLKDQYVEEHKIMKTLKEHQGLLINEGFSLSYAKSEEDAKEAAREYLKKHPEQSEKIERELREDYTNEFLEKVMGEKV